MQIAADALTRDHSRSSVNQGHLRADGETPAKMTSVSPCFHLDPSPETPAAPLPAMELNRLSSAQQRRLHAALEMQHCAAQTDQLYGVATRSAQQRLQRDLEIERSLASKFTMPRMDGDCCAPALDMRQGDMCVCAGDCNATCDVFAATWLSHYKQLLTLQEVRLARVGLQKLVLAGELTCV